MYKLEKYHTKASRHECPNCHRRHSFTYYVDDDNQPLYPTCGRCDHESRCGYHYTPKQYFQDQVFGKMFIFASGKKHKAMATYTITLNERTTSGKALINYLQALGVIMEKISPKTKSSYRRSQEDKLAGRVESFSSSEEMFQSLGI